MAKESSDEDEKSPEEEVKEMILSRVKSRRGKETMRWLNSLTEELDSAEKTEKKESSASAALPAQFSHPSIAQTQIKWVDKLFDLFQQYEAEFNSEVSEPELRFETERAVITQDLLSRMQGSDRHHYSGRLHTSFWTLVLLGNLSRIQGYIIPSDRYIGFEENASDYEKYFEFIPVWDGELKWSYEKGKLAFSDLPYLARRILSQLVKVAGGEAGPDEKFGGTAESISARRPGADGPTSISEKENFQALQGKVFEDDTSQADCTIKTAATTSSKETGYPPLEIELGSNLSVADLCKLLPEAINRELQQLSKDGARAFENHNLQEVEKIMRRSGKLGSFRERMLSDIENWKRQLEESN